MLWAERAKRQKLDTVLAQLDAAERRALADLAASGYRFQTVKAARSYQATVAAVERYNRDLDADALAKAFQEPPIRAGRTA